ncbi:scm-like with four MBT domains protein 1 [Glandiceps talaboti]
MKSNPQIIQSTSGQPIFVQAGTTMSQPLIQTTIVHQPSGVQTQIIQQPASAAATAVQPGQQTQTTVQAPQSLPSTAVPAQMIKPVIAQQLQQALLRASVSGTAVTQAQVVTIAPTMQLQPVGQPGTIVKQSALPAQKIHTLPQLQPQPIQVQLQLPSKQQLQTSPDVPSESKEEVIQDLPEEVEREPISSIDLAIMKNLLYPQAPLEKKKPEVKPQTEEAENDVTAEEPAEFTWEEYLEITGAMAVPNSSFKHVESSLESPFVPGMKLEVVNRNIPTGHVKTYWVATVIATCGQLLLMRYDGYESDRIADFWCDVTSGDLHPIGWCAQHSQQLAPPESIRDKCDNWSEFLVQDLTGAITAPVFLLEGDAGRAPADQIKPGMKVEVTHPLNPLEVWVAVIKENYGGRLLLRWEGATTDAYDFWLFYQSHRIHPVGWAQEKGYVLKPLTVLMLGAPFSTVEWTYIHQKVVCAANKMPLPKAFFRNQQVLKEHMFRVGMKLEAINPKAPSQICPATVVKVFNAFYFLVEIDDLSADKTPVQFLCYGGCGGLFPMDWCRYYGVQITVPNGYDCTRFDWNEYLKHCNSVAAPKPFFRTVSPDHEFQRGMKLEAINPFNASQICVATVTKIIDRHMWLHFDGWKLPNHIVDVESHDMFPVGWCESTGYPLKQPKKLLVKKTKKVAVVWPEKQVSSKSTPLSPGRDLYQKMREGPPRGDESGEEGKASHWSPKIYFNHKCFSGPYLNKGRIAELPRAVGPGIVTLVLKEVISLLINAAYKPPRVLRELQVEHEETAGMNGHLQVMKAKYKGKSYRAMVEICKAADEVDKFCRDMCIKLECCPNLVALRQIEDNCPENCSMLTKTKYTHYYGKKKRSRIGRPPGGHSNLEHGPRKPGKRRKRRKPFVHRKKRTSSNEEAGERKGNDEDDDEEEEEDDDDDIENGEGEGEEDEEGEEIAEEEKVVKRKKHKKERKLEIKVGMKRPLIMTRAKALLESAKRAKIPKILPDRERGKKMITRYGALASGSSHHHHYHHHHHHHRQPHQHHHHHASGDGSSTSKKRTTESRDKSSEEILLFESNPLHWPVSQVVDFIKTTDCAPLAKIFKEQEIDGQALLLLTLPTVQECMELKLGPAIKLCHHIERVKIAFYEQFAK